MLSRLCCYTSIAEMFINMFLDQNLHHFTHHDIGIYFGVDMEFCFFTMVVDCFQSGLLMLLHSINGCHSNYM
jgi:hypothetical protein